MRAPSHISPLSLFAFVAKTEHSHPEIFHPILSLFSIHALHNQFLDNSLKIDSKKWCVSIHVLYKGLFISVPILKIDSNKRCFSIHVPYKRLSISVSILKIDFKRRCVSIPVLYKELSISIPILKMKSKKKNSIHVLYKGLSISVSILKIDTKNRCVLILVLYKRLSLSVAILKNRFQTGMFQYMFNVKDYLYQYWFLKSINKKVFHYTCSI